MLREPNCTGARKQAREFADDYLEGETVVTPEEFINGQVALFCVKHGVEGVKMKTSVVSDFYNYHFDFH